MVIHRSSSTSERMRCPIRKKKNVAVALVTAASRLIRTATGSPRGARSRLQVRATETKSGFPGGWGMPSRCPVVMYSLASHQPVLGARVNA